MSSSSNSQFEQIRWVITIRRTLEEELEDDSENPVCIFNVPKLLMHSNPHSYIPQQLALGPYHHWRPEFFEMERCKISAAKRVRKRLQKLEFQSLVEQFIKLEPKIRACYHRYLSLNCETLAWMMALDACFLIEFIQIYAHKEGPSRTTHLLDYGMSKSAHNSILRDILVLENQIPLFTLRKVLELQFSSTESADSMMVSMLMEMYKEVSPFKIQDELLPAKVSECAHLLDFLYHSIVPRMEESLEIMEEVEDDSLAMADSEGYSADPSSIKQLLNEIWKLLLKLTENRYVFLKKFSYQILSVLINMPWRILSSLPGFAFLKKPIEIFLSFQNTEITPENLIYSNDKPPLVEEITIPSVTQLSRTGVRFLPTKGNLSTITFNTETATLYLPTITLDINSEVILRNLVAYEASMALGPVVFFVTLN
ncbi:hypothetical protein GH714_033397 [Hevea brasiliensis]|uniref:Uncharacterized protein n=1 Tax=Hevea brasiliensis TaxID=3981 RepID=A0A6A6NA95_HEVBR|nr:hypothetical protein GH714_033397 [Hevea brasiliensis]